MAPRPVPWLFFAKKCLYRQHIIQVYVLSNPFPQCHVICLIFSSFFHFISDEESMEEDSEDSFSDSDVSEAGEIFTPCVSFPTIVQEAVSSVELVPRLLSKLEPPAENVCGILSSNKDSQRLLVKFKLLQTRSLFCFHNLVSGLDVQCLGGADKLFELWTSISQEVLKSFEVQGEEFLEAASSAMRAIILKLAAEKYSSSIKLDQSDLEILFSATKKCPYDSIRAILIRNIGTFGTFFINSEQESVLVS